MLLKEFQKLSPSEQEALVLTIREMGDPAMRSPIEAQTGGGPVRIYDALSDGEYLRPMVDIETFIKDPYYLGTTCDNLYPQLVEDLKELFDGGYREAILTGSIGWGKTFFASIALIRVLYEISCLRDPHRSFGIAKDTNIALIAISVSEQLAMKVVFENIVTKIKQSPYFMENFPFEVTKREIRFPHNVWVAPRASTDTAALGLNVFGGIMDEGNFFENLKRGASANERWGNRDKAQALYDQLVRRMKSRFMRGGRMPGLMIVVSSKRTKEDFTAKRIRDSKDDPEVFVRDYAMWDVKREAYGQKTFHVLVGNETVPSRILKDEEVEPVREKLKESGQFDSVIIISVPEDFRKDFEADLEGSIRDVAGVETVSISPFIQQRDLLEKCLSLSDSPHQHPFSVEEWDQKGSGKFLWDRVASQVRVRDGAELFDGWAPKFHPGTTRHVHIDPSLTSDATGFCCGCVVGFKNVQRRNMETGETYTEPAPIIWIDLMLRIIPPIGGEIDQAQVRGLVHQMRQHGFAVGYLSMDQYNSAASLQIFTTQGIEAERVSVDKPMDAYDTLKAAIYENRLMMYRYEPVLKELRALQHDRIRNKVDHPRLGSKDVSDALAGVVYSLTTKYRGAPMGIVRGISQYGDPMVDQQREIVEPSNFFMPFLTG
jgi:hypothetical protein